jgi:hypothetical protein
MASDSTRAILRKFACIANLEQQQVGDLPTPGCEIYQNDTSIHNVTIGFQLKTLFRRDVSTPIVCLIKIFRDQWAVKKHLDNNKEILMLKRITTV